MLLKMRVLSQIDGDALVNYCVLYARWKKAEEFLSKHGEVYPIRDEPGRVKCMAQFPQVAISRNLAHLIKSYQQELGLTPSARTRVECYMPSEDDGLLKELLSGGRDYE